jgi:hypothetical protein
VSRKRGERSVGGSRPQERPAARREEEELAAATLATKRPEGKGTPMNIIRRPLELPSMRPVKDA